MIKRSFEVLNDILAACTLHHAPPPSKSQIPTEAKFKVSLLKVKIKLTQPQVKLELGLSLAIKLTQHNVELELGN